MSDRPSPRPSQSVFDQIEEALGATAHGRAFLRECGRRARSEETSLLLDAVARLERRARAEEDLDREEVASLVSQVESALRDARLAFGRSVVPARERTQPEEPPNVRSFGRETTGAIAGHVEVVQETAWRMRETGVDPALCDTLEAQTTAIYAACRRQERMLDGLGTIERAIGRADAFVGELKRALVPTPMPAEVPLRNTAPVTLLDSDIEFVVAAEPDAPEND